MMAISPADFVISRFFRPLGMKHSKSNALTECLELLLFVDQGIARWDSLLKSLQRHPEEVAALAKEAFEKA
jgi:hypothetical protein